MSSPFKSIAVYCGSQTGNNASYAAAARRLGELLAHRGITLVYGGGSVGLMGAVADAARAAEGTVVGVIPSKLMTAELVHQNLSELHVVESMHDRKMMMAQLSDAFIALPGGWGTLDELAEATTWTQLNYHLKPVGLLNVAGYFDGFLTFLRHASDEGFIRPAHRHLLSVDTSPERLLERMAAADIPRISDWRPGSSEPPAA